MSPDRSTAEEPSSPPLSKGKERLIEAAVELFGQDGFEGTSVRAIADRAGMSFALIRVAFGSKEGLRDAAEKAVFDEIFQLSGYSGFASSTEDVLGFIRMQAEQFRRLKPKLAFVRRCILEQRPSANAFLKRMIDHLREHDSFRIHGQQPEEEWLQDPIRMVMTRIGFILLAPNIEQLMGIDLLAMDQIERVNAAEVRLWQLVEAGLEAEKAKAKPAD